MDVHGLLENFDGDVAVLDFVRERSAVMAFLSSYWRLRRLKEVDGALLEELSYERLDEGMIRVDALDALTLARKAGSAKAVNIVLMGRLSTYFSDVPEEKWLEAIEQIVKPAFVELNKAAFVLGRNNK